MSGFEYCGYVGNIFKKRRVCDLYPFSDKVKMKELHDIEMVLKQRAKP